MPDRQTHLQARHGYYPVSLYPAVEEQGPQDKAGGEPASPEPYTSMGRTFDCDWGRPRTYLFSRNGFCTFDARNDRQLLNKTPRA